MLPLSNVLEGMVSTKIHPHRLVQLRNDTANTFTAAHSIAHAIRDLTLTADAQLQPQNNPCEQSATGDRIFSKYLTRSLTFHKRPHLIS